MLLADATSTSLTIFLAIIGGGAAGTLAATFWRIRHERAEAWRSRLLDAADDFATGALQALMKLESMDRWLGRSHEGGSGYLNDKELEAMREADALIDEARARLARVHLLFGSRSSAGSQATDLVEQLRALSAALWPDPDTSELDFPAADKAAPAARDALDRFGTAARLEAWKGRADES